EDEYEGIPTRRVEENEVQEEIPHQVEEVEQVPQGDQVPIVGGGDDPPKLSNKDIREALLALTRAVTTKVNLSMMPRVNVVERTMTSMLKDFVSMNTHIFLGSKVGEDPLEFIDEDVAQVWYTQWKGNRPKESGPIEWEKFKEVFLARIMVYAKSIEESKLKRMDRNMKRGGSSDNEQTRVKKRAQTQEEPRRVKVKFEKGGGSQNEKPTCVTCGKRHYGKCLADTSGCFGCGKNDDKVRDCPTIAARGRESKQVAPSSPKKDSPINRRFYALRARGSKPDENESDDDVGSSQMTEASTARGPIDAPSMGDIGRALAWRKEGPRTSLNPRPQTKRTVRWSRDGP
ncbi:hypothetical protein EJD97_000340, partial [Solanum chilense]